MRITRKKTAGRKQVAKSASPAEHRVFFFYEKYTGIARFRVEAGPDGHLPADQAAGLLAMHCLIRGQTPNDYMIMVQAADELVGRITEEAGKLLLAGRCIPAPIELTRREEQTLAGLMRSLANKEIAAELNLSERTVKFHVSSLLAKFRVRGRMELVRSAERTYLPSRRAAIPQPVPFPGKSFAAPAAEHPRAGASS